MISNFSTAKIVGANCFKMHSVVVGFLSSLSKLPTNCFFLLLLLLSCFLIGNCWASNKTTFTTYCLLREKTETYKNLTVFCWVQRKQKIKLKYGKSKMRHSLFCPQTNPSSFPPFQTLAKEQESETSSLGECGYDFEAEGSWERERKYFRALGSISVLRREKKNALIFCSPLTMSPVETHIPAIPDFIHFKSILFPSDKMDPSFSCAHLYSEQTFTKVWDTLLRYWFRESGCPLDSRFFEDSVTCASSNLAHAQT